ncbi:hypothetical protein Hanom_Chr02g00111051 [Helianthus anomalus]
MSSSSSWRSSSSCEGGLFFPNAIMLATQMIMEEEEDIDDKIKKFAKFKEAARKDIDDKNGTCFYTIEVAIL